MGHVVTRTPAIHPATILTHVMTYALGCWALIGVLL